MGLEPFLRYFHEIERQEAEDRHMKKDVCLSQRLPQECSLGKVIAVDRGVANSKYSLSSSHFHMWCQDIFRGFERLNYFYNNVLLFSRSMFAFVTKNAVQNS